MILKDKSAPSHEAILLLLFSLYRLPQRFLLKAINLPCPLRRASNDFFWCQFKIDSLYVDSVLSTSYCQFKKRLLCLFELGWWRFLHQHSLLVLAIGPSNGISEIESANDEPNIAAIGRCIFVVRKHSVDDLHFITETFRKHWTDWRSCAPGRICWRTPFTFHKNHQDFPAAYIFLHWFEVGRNLQLPSSDMTAAVRQLSTVTAPQLSHLLA